MDCGGKRSESTAFLFIMQRCQAYILYGSQRDGNSGVGPATKLIVTDGHKQQLC